MRSVVALLVSFSLVLLTLAPADAAADKTLENLKGSVGYVQTPNGATTPVAPKASIVAPDSFTAVTGPSSEGAIGLPDSSRVLVGQNSNVTLRSFNQVGILNRADFVVVGKVRFAVQHPGGAHASYTFSTGTAQIAVRGTTGDISWDAGTQTLQVNCYELTDPALPVQVTLAGGTVFTLSAGDSIVIHFPVSAADPPHVEKITRLLVDAFAEFGLPDNANQLGLIKHRSWFAQGGWLVLLPIILILTNQHPNDNPPTNGGFPVGVSNHIQP